ncbi:MAG TPA: hypothetical protein VGJ18_12450 [Gemmatimonadaceae bacterium]
MAVREIVDEKGKAWRVWCILPESIHPVTRAEDYLADCYQLGWLVFETVTGGEKRRLCPFPRDWERVDEQVLRSLLGRSEPVRPHRSSGERAAEREVLPPKTPAVEVDVAGDEKADLTDLTVVRTFRYPGGRIWSAAIEKHSDIAVGPVLALPPERAPSIWSGTLAIGPICRTIR